MEINVDGEYDATWSNCLESHRPSCQYTNEELSRSGSLLIRIEKIIDEAQVATRIYFVRENGERNFYARHNIPIDIIRTYFKPLSNAPTETYPHRCPRCGRAAYVGFKDVTCSDTECKGL